MSGTSENRSGIPAPADPSVKNLAAQDDPFCAAADPYPPVVPEAVRRTEAMTPAAPHHCHCDVGGPSLSRRQALLGVGSLALLPALAQADALLVPCIQAEQKPQPCRHKFCRYYAGSGDFHGRDN